MIAKLSKPIAEDELKDVIEKLRTHKALAQVREYLSKIASEANSLLEGLPNGAAKDALKNVAYVLVNRST